MTELLSNLAFIFFATLFMVGARVFQQDNVRFRRYLLIPIGSYIMGFSGFIEIAIGSGKGIDLHTFVYGFTAGTAGWIGCYVSMFFYDRLLNRVKQSN